QGEVSQSGDESFKRFPYRKLFGLFSAQCASFFLASPSGDEKYFQHCLSHSFCRLSSFVSLQLTADFSGLLFTRRKRTLTAKPHILERKSCRQE
ncbi:hypothetical protein, partial [Pantoea sp. UBA5037]|uniref:hypothetical protein n=1 Tax=Pantoea sp. UBA5037 TaxID=1947036 RepID=UPI0025806DA8